MELKFVYGEVHSLIMNDAFFSGFTDFNEIPGMLDPLLYVNESGWQTCYTTQKELDRVKKQGKLFLEKKYRDNFSRKIQSTFEEFRQFYVLFKKKAIERIPNNELLRFFLEYVSHLKSLFAYYQVAGGNGD